MAQRTLLQRRKTKEVSLTREEDAMSCTRNAYFRRAGFVPALLAVLLWMSSPALARDTDIYQVHVKQNCYILLDTSESMDFGVYQNTIDYGAMFDYLFTLYEANPPNSHTYIYDTINNSNYFYQNHEPVNKIYLWLGAIGATSSQVTSGGSTKTITVTGDASDPGYLWYMNNLVDTHTLIDVNGNLTNDGSGHASRLTVDSNPLSPTYGHMLFDGNTLPFGQDITQHNYQTLYNGSVIDTGFAGLLNAPGYYFSGYQGISPNVAAVSGNTNIYFFVTGNWVNMQAMYNLHYVAGSSPQPAGATPGAAAWVYEYYPLSSTTSWPITPETNSGYPQPSGGTTYAKSQSFSETITAPGEVQMQVHFSLFDVKGDGSASTFKNDYVQIYDSNNVLVAQYDNDNSPITANGGWSPVISGSSAKIVFHSSSTTTGGKGFNIDQIRSITSTQGYLMQSRIAVAKAALTTIIDAFKNEINWGFAYTTATGATIGTLINPNQTASANEAAVYAQMANANPPADNFSNQVTNNTTPLMEALQDVWVNGFYGQRSTLNSQPCRNNYVLTMSSGYASHDNDGTRINTALSSAPVFSNATNLTSHPPTFNDGNVLTQDPYQYQNVKPIPLDYYDGVANWIYNHSWVDGSVVSTPTSSFVNVVTDNISFGSTQPLMQAASTQGGGQYMSVYNTQQLTNAFYSLGLMITQAVSFTSPVVSVDAANKIQSGSDLYMGLFLPQAGSQWTGNLKKFELGDGSAARPDLDMIYDANNVPAITSSGQFVLNNAPWWGKNIIQDTTTSNIENGGAGQVMLAALTTYFTNKTYWNRPIYTWKNGAMVHFDRANIVPADLGINTGNAAADNATRDQIVNFIHGYTYGADSLGNPVALRDWPLGAIIHSQPTVVDYYNNASPSLPLLQRYVAVGSDDGMLHVFSDTVGSYASILGQEVFSFIPPDILLQLKNVQANNMYDTVDGPISLYRWPSQTTNVDYNATHAKNPRYLIFGERRGGGTFWSLEITSQNPLKWTYAWSYTNPELSQSWSIPQVASIPISVASNGARTYKDVVIFTGGYDAATEDNYPEPFVDSQTSPTGNPYTQYPYINSNIDPTKWNPSQGIGTDYNGNGKYDKYNPGTDVAGRGIFVGAIDNPTGGVYNVTPSGGSLQQLLPFQVTYNAAGVSGGTSTGNPQTRSDMPFSFPASPTVVTSTDQILVYVGGIPQYQYADNVIQAIYAVDIYGDIFKTMYTFTKNIHNQNQGVSASNPNYQLNTYQIPSVGSQVTVPVGWSVNKVFSANPGSLSASGTMGVGSDSATGNDDSGRKVFFPPTISWGGTTGYFVADNYSGTSTLGFNNLDTLASLFLGTGDVEHPTYTMIRNRFYAVYDDSSVTATNLLPSPSTVAATTAPYLENNLLNLTCDELDTSTVIKGAPLNGSLFKPFTTSANQKNALRAALENFYDSNFASEENTYAKGWYITLADQGSSSVCSQVSYPTTLNSSAISSADNHVGEQILDAITLFYGTAYFTSYQPSIGQPCNPQGNGFSYSINYQDGTTVYNLNNTTVVDVADRYVKFVGISGIPSAFTIIIRHGQAAAMASMGGAIIGPGGYTTPPAGNPKAVSDQYKVNSPPSGAIIYYWRDSNSMQ
jgi:type IV pilus assembly protein PilY1